MLKRIILVSFILLMTACTSVDKVQSTGTGATIGAMNSSEIKKLDSYIYNWQLNEASTYLSSIEKTKGSNSSINKYKRLIAERKSDVRELNVIIEELKSAIKRNDFNTVKKYFVNSMSNNFKLNKLSEGDYSGINIYSGNPQMKGDKADLLVLLNYMEETIYVDLAFDLINSNWKVSNIKERRWYYWINLILR